MKSLVPGRLYILYSTLDYRTLEEIWMHCVKPETQQAGCRWPPTSLAERTIWPENYCRYVDVFAQET